jgi:hypothetical protein
MARLLRSDKIDIKAEDKISCFTQDREIFFQEGRSFSPAYDFRI